MFVRRGLRALSPIWRIQAAAVLGFALLTTSCGAAPTPTVSPPSAKGLVVGGILPCAAMISSSIGTHYVAGEVVVLKGLVAWKPVARGTVPVLPDTVVAREAVSANASYRFALDPGRYVLQAHYSYPSSVDPFIAVTVKIGTVLNIDIPDTCI